jgi:hypothetical protein
MNYKLAAYMETRIDTLTGALMAHNEKRIGQRCACDVCEYRRGLLDSLQHVRIANNRGDFDDR